MAINRQNIRSQKSEEKKKHIYECAIALFSEFGFEKVTIKDIASASESSVGSIYHYFRDKESIALYRMKVLDEKYKCIFDYIMEDKKCEHWSAIERLKYLCVNIQNVNISLGDISLALVYINGLRHPERDGVRMDKRELYKILDYLIEQCKKEGSISTSYNNEDIKRRIIFISRGILHDWIYSRHGFNLQNESDFMMSSLLSRLQSPEISL